MKLSAWRFFFIVNILLLILSIWEIVEDSGLTVILILGTLSLFLHYLRRKKGKNFQSFATRKAILENLKGVVEVLGFDDADGSASRGIELVRQRYPDDVLVFANGGDRGKDNIPEIPTCRKCDVGLMFGVGGVEKVNSSSKLLAKWNS